MLSSVPEKWGVAFFVPLVTLVLSSTCALAQVGTGGHGEAAGKQGQHQHQQPQEELPPFGKVDDVVLTLADFRAAMMQAVRTKFYHGQIPEEKMAALQREVAQEMVDKVLLLREAKRRGIEPDKAEVKKIVEQYDKKYANSERWKKERDQIIPDLTRKMEEDSILKIFEKKIKDAVNPTEKEVRRFYKDHPEKFTEPEQVKVSAILLKVDPSSPKEVWEEAVEEAKGIVERLRGGADFAELAKIHSGDPSAEQGGDMGYLHRGMLAENVHQTLDKVPIGEITDPVVILQGVGVFRLDDRKESKLNTFDNVRERARGLLVRELADKAWEDLKAGLRSKAAIEINESYYLPLPEKKEGAGEEQKGGEAAGHTHGG